MVIASSLRISPGLENPLRLFVPDPDWPRKWRPQEHWVSSIHQKKRRPSRSFLSTRVYRRTRRMAVPSPSPSGPRSHTSKACQRRYDSAVSPGHLPVVVRWFVCSTFRTPCIIRATKHDNGSLVRFQASRSLMPKQYLVKEEVRYLHCSDQRQGHGLRPLPSRPRCICSLSLTEKMVPRCPSPFGPMASPHATAQLTWRFLVDAFLPCLTLSTGSDVAIHVPW